MLEAMVVSSEEVFRSLYFMLLEGRHCVLFMFFHVYLAYKANPFSQ